MRRIIVLSQRLARKLSLDVEHAIVSLRDPHDEFTFPMRWGRRGVLPLYFTDLEKPSSEADIISLKMMTRHQAMQAWEFIREHEDVDTLVIHCFAGKSRSSGMATAVGECLGVPVTHGPEPAPNQHVYQLMKRAYMEQL